MQPVTLNRIVNGAGKQGSVKIIFNKIILRAFFNRLNALLAVMDAGKNYKREILLMIRYKINCLFHIAIGKMEVKQDDVRLLFFKSLFSFFQLATNKNLKRLVMTFLQ